jgi:hypothetical protein
MKIYPCICLIKHQAMKTYSYGGVEYVSTIFNLSIRWR